ncbi:MAG TPA: nucleoid-associated protein [Chitinophagaceae bacterium]|nr:nucleoid-associated protein [Chitinophagaceae bacterium]
MIQIEETVISQTILHRVNAANQVLIAGASIFDNLEETENAVLKKLFLKPFMSHAITYEFHHGVDLDYNVLFGLAKNIYEGGDFMEQSKNIAQHLLDSSKHPNIKDGDLLISRFLDIQLGNRHYEGLGIYKFEDKESFIETSLSGQQTDLKFRKGLGAKKPDKACLILFTDEPYTLLIIDSNSSETEYWQNEFIKHRSKNDSVNNTHDFLTLAKNFITDQIPQEYEVNRTEQLNLLNRSVEYFKSHETFDKQEFEEEVFQHDNIIKSFRNFDESWREEHELDLSDNFEISAQAVKKQARVFKSILKLDKNFHIYIHGNRELIEQGVDNDGRKFYKIYYESES